MLVGGGQDRWPGHHHAKIDHVVAIALEHHADDVLADVVNIALHRRHDDLALGLALGFGKQVFLGLDEGNEVGDRLLHHARGFHHLRQEHLAAAEQVADDVHAVHQRAFDHLDRAIGGLARFLGILDDMRVDALDQRVFEPPGDRPAAPFLGSLFVGDRLAFEAFGQRDQALGRVRVAVEDHVLAGLAQRRVDLVVDVELARVDDRHVEARRDRVVEEHRMHRAAHRLVAAEREGEVRQPARVMRVGAELAQFAHRLDEVDAVIVVLLDPRRHREDVGVEDDVFGREALGHQQVIGALADFDFPQPGIGLPRLVEGHHNHRSAVIHALARVF